MTIHRLRLRESQMPELAVQSLLYQYPKSLPPVIIAPLTVAGAFCTVYHGH